MTEAMVLRVGHEFQQATAGMLSGRMMAQERKVVYPGLQQLLHAGAKVKQHSR
jgi:hypothetical protein